MRVASYNIHDCIGRDRRYDPARIVQVLAELDVELIALQEITLDHAGSLVDRFEAATGMHAIDGTVFERGVGRYGNLLLTNHRVLDNRQHDLSYPGREPRGVVDVSLQVAGEPLRVCVTHLGLVPRERREQLRRLAELLGDGPDAAMLLGDFNVLRGSGALAPLAAVGLQHRPVRSFPTWPFPLVALDRILARAPLTVTRCWRHDSPLARIASDHYPLVAEVAGLKASPPAPA